jgi:hypothetical protein
MVADFNISDRKSFAELLNFLQSQGIAGADQQAFAELLDFLQSQGIAGADQQAFAELLNFLQSQGIAGAGQQAFAELLSFLQSQGIAGADQQAFAELLSFLQSQGVGIAEIFEEFIILPRFYFYKNLASNFKKILQTEYCYPLQTNDFAVTHRVFFECGKLVLKKIDMQPQYRFDKKVSNNFKKTLQAEYCYPGAQHHFAKQHVQFIRRSSHEFHFSSF